MKISIRKIILLLITCGFLYLVFSNMNFTELANVIKKFDFRYLFLLFISIFISLSFRAVCFKQLISKTVPNAPLKDLIPLCITSAALNIVLPARAGDIFRAYYTGQKYSTSKVKIFGTVMLERIFDVSIIFCMLCLGVFVYHKNQLAMNLCIFAGIAIVSGILFVVLTYKYNKIDVICDFINQKGKNLPISSFIEKMTGFVNRLCNSFFTGFEVIESPKNVLYALLAVIGIWFFDCLNYFIVISGFGIELHWSVTLFIISFIALACMIPSTSIFVGPYQLAVISAFAIYDVSKEAALAMSLLEQSAVTVFVSIVAALFLIKNNISYKELKEDINEKLK